MNILRPKRFLLEALKIAGLPFSYLTLLKYERLGILPKAINGTNIRVESNFRLYTGQEILEAVEKIMTHKYPDRISELPKINEKIIKYLNKHGK
jgi:hypothetical protein